MLHFIHQPLTTLGTEGDATVVVARVPVLVNAVLGAVAWPNKLPQSDSAGVEDSNFISLLDIHLSAELVSGRHFSITLDLRDMRPCEPYGVTAEEVIAGTIQCLKKTMDADVNYDSYELHVLSRKDDKTDWSQHEGRFDVKHKRKTP